MLRHTHTTLLQQKAPTAPCIVLDIVCSHSCCLRHQHNQCHDPVWAGRVSCPRCLLHWGWRCRQGGVWQWQQPASLLYTCWKKEPSRSQSPWLLFTCPKQWTRYCYFPNKWSYLNGHSAMACKGVCPWSFLKVTLPLAFSMRWTKSARPIKAIYISAEELQHETGDGMGMLGSAPWSSR